MRGDGWVLRRSPQGHTGWRAGVPAGIAVAILSPERALAAAERGILAAYLDAFAALDRHEVAALALTLGVVFFAVITSILLVRTRIRAAVAEAAAREKVLALQAEVDRSNALLLSEPQVLFIWTAGVEEPDIVGDTSLLTSNPIPRRALAFSTWLPAEDARAMESAVSALRSRGQAFALSVVTPAQRHIEAEGRPVGSRVVVRLREVSGARRELAELSTQHQRLVRSVETLQALIETLPAPIWARDPQGWITWANAAYALAVEASDPQDAIQRRLELLDRVARDEIEAKRAEGDPYAARLPIIAAGARRFFDVFDLPTRSGSAGIAIDVTQTESLRSELARLTESHRRTLDQLSAGVAVFSREQKLVFYNSAYCKLWGFEPASLEGMPSDSALLDRLRAARKLPEQADFRNWKVALHEAYRAIEPNEHWWHLPDGRAIRVVTTPTSDGGVTYLFNDVTERLELERRYDAMNRVQGETLDHLAEGVAVFGSDGRLRLFNPSFARMWKLSPASLGERPHIETVIDWCRPLHWDDQSWQALRAAVTGFEQREPMQGRLDRSNGSVVQCATVPLPDGGTLVTFQDVTDSVNIERALRERNEALEITSDLKNDFVHHVSYELRSPLTSIIGFAQMLDEGAAGPLTEKQREYLGYITASSSALLAIINDILDLATIDAGVMTLNLGPVDIRTTVDGAAEGVRDRLAEHAISLDLHVPADIGAFVADERRVRQVLYNLLSNAIGFSPEGETVVLAAERRDAAIVFSVTDHGLGIPPDILARVFERFETHSQGSRHRGAGLGLSIVRSLVELHGGEVQIVSQVGRGTTVTCVFPSEEQHAAVAAE